MKEITVHTDGSCRKNPGPGGWAAYLRKGKKYKVLSGAEEKTTNNRMELMGVIGALEYLDGKGPYRVNVYSDSQYVIKGVTEWMRGWRLRKWRSAQGAPIKNQDLWIRLDSLRGFHEISWNWVRGHIGDVGNEVADRVANDVVVHAGLYALRQSDHYEFLATYLAKFWTETTGEKMSGAEASAFSGAHGDKGYQYKGEWEENKIHFYHGMLLYMLTFSRIMDRPKSESSQWVIDHYMKYRHILPQL